MAAGDLTCSPAVVEKLSYCSGSQRQPMQIAVDCRYVRERPSGIGAYVEALARRVPDNAPAAQFVFWKDSRARGPLSTAPNVREVTVGAGPNSPLTILWPRLFASLDGDDLFHNPHNILPRGIRCRSVVTVHDVLAIDNARLHRRGLNRLKGFVLSARGVAGADGGDAIDRAERGDCRPDRVVGPGRRAKNRRDSDGPGQRLRGAGRC